MSDVKGGVARRVPLPDGTYTRAPEGTDVVAKVVESPAKKSPRTTHGAQTK